VQLHKYYRDDQPAYWTHRTRTLSTKQIKYYYLSTCPGTWKLGTLNLQSRHSDLAVTV